MSDRLRTARPGPRAIAAAAVFFSCAYFYQAGGWNQNSRYDLVRAVVEQGSIRIDRYHQNTGDKARSGGQFYTDKAPGQPLFAALFYAPGYWVARAAGADPGSRKSVAVLSYLATLGTAALPMVLAVLALFAMCRRLGASDDGAFAAAAIFAVGTPAWAYATLFMGHALATALLVVAAAAALALRDEGSRRRDWLFGLTIGGGAGWATLTEYPAMPGAVIVAALAIATVWPSGRRRVVRVAAAVGLSALACAAVMMVYHHAAFGRVFTSPLSHLHGFAHVRENPFTWPKGGALADVLWGPKRGLLVIAPVLALAPVGYALWLRRREQRLGLIAGLLIVGYYLVLVCSFATPMGGWAFGPRYIAAALPFLCVGLALLWSACRRRWQRIAIAALAVWGVAVTGMTVSTTAQLPEQYEKPFTQLTWPAFKSGDLSLNHQSFLDKAANPFKLRGRPYKDHDAFNLGELIGLRGHASLVPLLIVWALAGWWLWRWRRRQPMTGSR